MSEEINFIYNTRSSAQTFDAIDFYSRLDTALSNDIQNYLEEDVDVVREINPYPRYGDENDLDYYPDVDASDIEEDLVIEPNEVFNSDDEEEPIENQTTQQATTDKCFYGKDGTKWNKKASAFVGRLYQDNILRIPAGPKEQRSISTEVFKKFFTPNIAFIIITNTNRFAQDTILKWNTENPAKKPKTWTELTSIELDAFVGILFAIGVTNNNTQTAYALWQSDNLAIFRTAMSQKRFLALLKYIRFDDKRTRAFRQQTDKAAPIRDIWNFFNENLANNYDPHEAFTVDEQFFPYRGRTKFTQYIPSKPAKYGIKFWWACDSRTNYPLQGTFYTGRDEKGEERDTRQGENVLLQLSNRYTNSGLTVIADNFFTTLDGVKRLENIGIGFVGTIHHNQRCIPKEMKKDHSRPVLSSEFGFHDKISICSYVPKKNKAVILLSTEHYSKACKGVARKPAALSFYDQHKPGVDCMEQMLSHFSTKRSTKRWTLAFFYNMLDVMALAAFCISKEVDSLDPPKTRRTFLNILSNTLILPNISGRMDNVHVVKHFSNRIAMESYFGRPITVCIQNQ